MLAKTISGAMIGLDGQLVTVEVDITQKGFGAFKIVGLAGKAVDESRDRVKAAIENSGLDFTKYRITVNLAPADLPKEGPLYDLPIAVALLIADGKIKPNQIGDRSMFIGELSLDGSLSSTPAILPLAMLAQTYKIETLFVPAINAPEATIVKNVQVIPVESLKQLIGHFNGIHPIEPLTGNPTIIAENTDTDENYRLEDIQGQEFAKRALIVAAAGGHNLFMNGPPGAGKTMLARTLPSLLPTLTWEEALDVTRIHSVCHLVDPQQPLITQRPFRAPHHTISRVGLVGGGAQLTPGEISLAHRGVLFLDEIPEFPRSVLEAMRQPLEDGHVIISRAKGSAHYPTRFMLIAASNPCPCGYLGSTRKQCICPQTKIYNYQRRLSGPLLDRMDIHVFVQDVSAEEIVRRTSHNGNSATNNDNQTHLAQTQIQAARELQTKRFADESIHTNAEMTARMIKKYCPLTSELDQILIDASNQLGLSARAIHKTIKLARTIADLDAQLSIEKPHLHEALNYRRRVD